MKESEGWVNLLNQKLTEQNSAYKIVNASISGETTEGGLSRLPGILAEKNADYLLIELGGNDGLRGFPPRLIKNNLLQIIELAQAANVKVMLMEIKIPPNYGPRYNKMFAAVYRDLAQKYELELMPFFIEQVAVDSSLMLADGIHPNQKAQPILAEFMKKQLDTRVK